VISNSLDVLLPSEGWWFPVVDFVDVDSGVQVLSSVGSVSSVVERAR